jgi:hypothetical protein
MAFENESLEADNSRYSAEVTDLAGENSALLAENSELRAQGDELLTEVRNMRRALAVGRTDLLYLKLKLRAFEMRLNEEGDDGHLLEDIEEWKRNWRLAKGMRDGDGAEMAQAEGGGSDDTRSSISLGDGSQLVITRATGLTPRAGRITSLSAIEVARSESVDEDDGEAMDDEYEEEADDEEEDETSPDSETADDEAGDDATVTQEQEEAPELKDAGKTPWERLWDDLAAFAGVHD